MTDSSELTTTSTSARRVRLQPNIPAIGLFTVFMGLPALAMMWAVIACALELAPLWLTCGGSTTVRVLSAIILAGTALGAVALVTSAWLQLTTRFSDDGVSQLTMRGTVFLPWHQVRLVETHRSPIAIIGDHARVEVSVHLFRNTGDLRPLLRSKLEPGVLR